MSIQLGVCESDGYSHEKLEWLKEDNLRLVEDRRPELSHSIIITAFFLRDKDGRRINDPDYNPRTLKVRLLSQNVFLPFRW